MKDQIIKIILLLLLTHSISAQIIDIRHNRDLPLGPGGAPSDNGRPVEFLKKGGFAFTNNFATQANSEIVRIRIGDNERNSIPFILLLSSPSLGLGKANLEQITFQNLLSQTGGIINTFLTDSRKAATFGSKTTLSINYGAGYKLVNGRIKEENDPLNLSTFYGDFGIRFVTGAYVAGDPSKNGTFILQIEGFATTAIDKKSRFADTFGANTTKWLYGIYGDVSLFVTNTIDLRFSFAQSFSNWDLGDDSSGYVKFSANKNF